ncbi:MAG: hypothetical protein LBF59_02880 [Prevotellaceae bacterium]|jgi:predicted transcriptional regulator of viral defense system|nr:hypothetical protein [Prevotellaceae bacterium]
MKYLEFRKQFIDLGCFSAHQVYAVEPAFDRNNLTRWQKQQLIVKLRQGFYAFRECIVKPNFAMYLSNFIYKPSYISLHSALAFYGMIPEAVTQIIAVSSLKTAEFENDFALFIYKKIKPELMFGYLQKPFGERVIRLATPEKALLDLLYLYPFYNTEEEIENLRLDDDFIRDELNVTTLINNAERFNNKALIQRVKLLKKIYNI